MIRLLLVTVTLSGGAALAFPPRPTPSATPAPPPMPTPNDRYDLIVLGPQRPYRVAVRVQYEGKSLAERWATGLKAVFAAFDRDGNGFLNGVEVKRVFSDTSAAGMLQNGFYSPFPNDLPTLAWLDADGDGRVSFAEFAGYYRQAAAAAAQAFPPQPENSQNAAATEGLFALLDADGDGKLTRAEVAAAERMVVARDTDEDECLSLAELLGQGFGVGVVRPGGLAPPRAVVPPVTVARPGEPLPAVREHVRTAYDWTKFGRPTGGEAARWWTDPADADVTLSFAPKAEECRATVTTDPAVLAARGFTVAQTEPRRLVIRHGRQSIDLSSYVGTVAPNRGAGLRVQYLAMFDAAAKGRTFITDADVGGTNAPQYQLLRVLFDPADADADGKLSRAELTAHLEVFEAFAAPAVGLTPSVQMPTLFQLLDDNRDGRLSVRELRTAWDRLSVLEPPGADGRVDAITKAAIMPAAVLRLSRPIERVAAVFLGSVPQQPPGGGGPQAGPVWFRKMDRNADGDVSRAEFLGTRAEFDAMDTDRDGLISPREADAFDAAARKND